MDNTHDAILVIEVLATDPATIHWELTAAEELAKARAIEDGSSCGILVTQHDFTHFTVAVTPEVPFGETRERRLGSAANMRRTDQWQLLPGKTVEVRCQGQIYRRGRVDDAMPDGSGLWLEAHAGRTREFIDKAPGFDVWVSAHLLFSEQERAQRHQPC